MRYTLLCLFFIIFFSILLTSGFSVFSPDVYAIIGPAPDITSTVAGTDGSITVTWSIATSSSVFTTYELRFSTTSGFTPGVADSLATCSDMTTIATVSCTVDATTDGLVDGTTYYFRIRATDDQDTGTGATEGSAISTTISADIGVTGSGCNDCEAPTLGVSSESKRIVDDGFTYNGKPTDAERFFTAYPLITTTVGKQNTAVFKIYEDKGPENIKHFSFAFGLDKGESIGESKAMIELDIDHEGTETVTVTDPENALDNIKVSTNIENCNGNDSDTQCLIVTIDHRFRALLDFNIVGTDVWDMERNSWQNYFNHGIEITGESLNPAKEYDGINKGHIYHLTETSKTTAVDEFGNSWSFQYGKWMKDYVKNEKIKDTSSVFTRTHSDFTEYKEIQAQNAMEQLLDLCSTCLDSYADFDSSFGYEYQDEQNKLDNPETIQKMILENEKAQKIMNYLLDPYLKYKLSYYSNK